MFLEKVFADAADSGEKLRVLDLCGSPGGKSTHISDLIGPSGLLVSNEVIRSRASILAETLTKWGPGNVLVSQNDPSVLGRLTGYFDMILVDAPCSGEGMFRSETALSEWSSANALHCSERQKRILMNVWPALKENGILVYSTCTFNPGENEENLKWFIEKNEAECINLDISGFDGITEIDFEGISGYGFYPHKVRGEGFFISAIRKTGKQEVSYVKYQKNNGLRPDKNDTKVAEEWTDISKERLLKSGDGVMSVSCGIDDYLHLYKNLKIIKAGTNVFVVKNKNYLPSHELALSRQLKQGVFPDIGIELSEALSYMRRDNFNLINTPKGWNIVRYKGINLGFVNNLGNRLNNYFPVEWRIRMDLPEAGKENIIEWE
jgi:NOL1/NOP2/fmu family ribosome biogenesis protein